MKKKSGGAEPSLSARRFCACGKPASPRSARRRGRRGAAAAIAVILAAAALDTAANRLGAEYGALDKTDRTVLSELDTFFAARSGLWSGFPLGGKTVLAVRRRFGNSYLVNPGSAVRSVFAVRVKMPEGSALRVYRISRLAPAALRFRLDSGAFNEAGRRFSAFGNDVFFLKYGREAAEKPRSSGHFLPLLCHEAFHYYMQDGWAGGGRFTGALSPEDLELLRQEYDVLARVQEALSRPECQDGELAELAALYAETAGRRIARNPQYLKDELSMETAEGTASYVSFKAADLVRYDLGVMYFDNARNVSFAEVIPMLEAGRISPGFLSARMPYETGALLCFLLDALRVPGWQDALNRQSPDAPVRLYDILADFARGNRDGADGQRTRRVLR